MSNLLRPARRQPLSLPQIFITVALKDFLTPYAFHYALGNPMTPPIKQETAFSSRQQWIALSLGAVYAVIETWPAAWRSKRAAVLEASKRKEG